MPKQAMKPFDYAKARQNLRKKVENRNARFRALWERAAVDAASIVDMIARDYPVQRIYQWGSVLHPERFSDISDIDIAIEGDVDVERFFEMLGKAEQLTGFSVDLVQLEKIEPEFAELIKRKGRIVYDRNA